MTIPFRSHWAVYGGPPTAWVEVGSGGPCAHHPLAGWRKNAEVYLDGTMRPQLAEFVSRYFAPAPFRPGHRRARAIIGDTTVEKDLQRLPGVGWVLVLASAQATVPLTGGFLHLE